MLYGLVYFTWFDITTLALTFTTIVIVQLLNAAYVTSSTKSSSSAAATAATTTLKPITEIENIKTEVVTTIKTINGKFNAKQKSLQRDDSLQSSGRSTPLLKTARNSFDSGCILPPTPPPILSAQTASSSSSSSPSTPSAQSQLGSLSSINYTTPLAPFITKPTTTTIAYNAETTTLPPSTSPTQPPPPPPPLPHINNSNSLHTIGSSLSLSDEYQEDEDTISLENLFPCDQSEIYASKKISFIIDELIQTESNYVNNLRRGVQMYGRLHKRQDVPETLQGEHRQLELLGNIEEILRLHDREILPMMLRNRSDLKLLFDEFAAYFHKNHFYSYVIYSINEKTSMRLRCSHREWFQNLQNEVNDKLGIDSFLVQPIQRLTRYPLLLQQFISEFYKSGISCKPVLMSVCKLETRMRRWLEIVNQAQEISDIEDISEPSLLTRGEFRKSTEFDAYHHRTRKRYRAKVFLFDHCLLCAEVRKRRLVYRAHYDWLLLELQPNSLKSVSILVKTTPTPPPASATALASASPSTTSPSSLAATANGGSGDGGSGANDIGTNAKIEYEFNASEAITVKHWLHTARTTIERARIDSLQRGKFSLPMDLVLGVLLAIWLIWIYL